MVKIPLKTATLLTVECISTRSGEGFSCGGVAALCGRVCVFTGRVPLGRGRAFSLVYRLHFGEK